MITLNFNERFVQTNHLLKNEKTNITSSVCQKFIKKMNSLNFLSQTSLKQMIFGWATLHHQKVERLISHGKRKSKVFRKCLKMRLIRYLINLVSLIYFLSVGMVSIPLCFAVYLARKFRWKPS